MIKRVFIYILLFLGTMSCLADGVYKNELTKVNLSPVGVNDVKVTLHMAKPYSEPLRLLKKNDSEFVLILPETYNSSPQKPSISEVIGDVTDTDVKLYSFISNSKENGYTKIVIKTNGTTNLYPEVVSNGGGTIKLNSDVKKAVSEKVQNKTSFSTVKIASLSKENTVQKQTPDIAKTTPKYQEKTNIIKKDVVPNIPKLNLLSKVVNNAPIQQPEEEPTETEDTINQQVTESDAGAAVDNNVETPTLSVTAIKDTAKPISFHKNRFGKKSIAFVLLLAACYGIIKKSKKHGAKINNSDNEQTEQYSDFFKTLIEEEVHGNNPFAIKTEYEDITLTNDVAPTGGVMEANNELLNIDPNLSWQEKFRALKKNKKELFKEEPKVSSSENKDTKTEKEENETMENPITKIKHDFKAVKKLLAQKKEQEVIATNDKPIEQKFVGDVEIISFDEYQKTIEPPKVQINTTSPIKSKAPKILSQLQFTPQKGIYLVDYKDKYNLVGFVNDKVFKLNTYNVVRNTKIYARLSETADGKDTYIVKFDNNKLLIDVDDNQMKLKLQY